MLTKKNRVWAVVALLTGVIGFSSCLKNDTNITPPRPMAQINVLNASTNPVAASFYDNGQRISNDTTNIGLNFYARYAVYGGPHTFELRKKGGDSVINTNTTNYDSSSYYTYVIYDNNPVKSIAVLTDFKTADPAKINIRCLNLSPGATKVDFYVGNQKIDSNRAYMTGSELVTATRFAQFGSFSINNTITIKKAGTTEVLANNDKLRITSFNVNGVYTIYFTGIVGVTGANQPYVNAFYSYYN